MTAWLLFQQFWRSWRCTCFTTYYIHKTYQQIMTCITLGHYENVLNMQRDVGGSKFHSLGPNPPPPIRSSWLDHLWALSDSQVVKRSITVYSLWPAQVCFSFLWLMSIILKAGNSKPVVKAGIWLAVHVLKKSKHFYLMTRLSACFSFCLSVSVLLQKTSSTSQSPPDVSVCGNEMLQPIHAYLLFRGKIKVKYDP